MAQAKFLNEDVLPFFINANESGQEIHKILWKNSIPKQMPVWPSLPAVSYVIAAAIPEGDSEEEPLKPTDRQAISHKIKETSGFEREIWEAEE